MNTDEVKQEQGKSKFELPNLTLDTDILYQISRRFFLVMRLALSIEINSKTILVQLMSSCILLMLTLSNYIFGIGKRLSITALLIAIIYYTLNLLIVKSGEKKGL